jgi:tRNA 2-thiouridine synthesizing protein E
MSSDTTTAKRYQVDSNGFLISPDDWNEEFALANAGLAGIEGGLTDEHWTVIRFIRQAFEEGGIVPLAYVTCMKLDMRLADLKRLFPAGYHRGVCRLAGVAYGTDESQERIEPQRAPLAEAAAVAAPPGHYRTDMLGFLLDPADWNKEFAVATAAELGMQGGLTPEHWQVISYLREVYERDGILPTLYETCDDNDLELDDLRRLFPDGYHRGAVRVAGLRFWKVTPRPAVR